MIFVAGDRIPSFFIRLLLALFTGGCLLLAPLVSASPLLIYHDADYTGHSESARSMAMGFNTALAEAGHQVQGIELKLVPKDHRGNILRSQMHLEDFIKDNDALMVLGGLHSPPYIVHRDFINQNGILLMVPWAAGGAITRYADGPNWVFRVSVDDTNAGDAIARFAVERKQCKAPHLLLENTAWGKANHNTISAALKALGTEPSGLTWFDWNTKANVAGIVLRDIRRGEADCIIFVGNAIEGAVFSRAITTQTAEDHLPVISHWGITGGSFHQVYATELHGKIDLSFIQTCFSFLSDDVSEQGQAVFSQARALYPDRLKTPQDLPAPPGFIHAYDTGRIFLAALNSITLGDDMAANRKALRQALENLDKPVPGLLKTYHRPFQPWRTEHPDAHEALGLQDYCMARYDSNGHIRLVNQAP